MNQVIFHYSCFLFLNFSMVNCFIFQKKIWALNFRVTVGEINNASPPNSSVYEIEHVFVHPKFGSNVKEVSDIAIIFLKENLTFSENVGPICLSHPSWANEKTAFMSGWGLHKTYVIPKKSYFIGLFLSWGLVITIDYIHGININHLIPLQDKMSNILVL